MEKDCRSGRISIADIVSNKLGRTIASPEAPRCPFMIHDVRTGEMLPDCKLVRYNTVFHGARGYLVVISSELQPDHTHKGNGTFLDLRNGRLLATDGRDRAVRVFGIEVR